MTWVLQYNVKLFLNMMESIMWLWKKKLKKTENFQRAIIVRKI